MGGRGSSNPQGGGGATGAFRRMTSSEQFSTIRTTQKQLTSAKAQETKAMNDYRKADGAVLMSSNSEMREKYQKEATKAYNKYLDAQQKRTEIENLLDQYTRIMRRRRR